MITSTARRGEIPAHQRDKEKIMQTRVLIVDDHRAFRDALKAVINQQSDMAVVGEAEDGDKAVALTRGLLPDIILMDVKMPILDGAEATSRILAELPGMKILALSIYADDEFMAAMMRAGALGYILKGCDAEELSDTIRSHRTASREAAFSSSFQSRLFSSSGMRSPKSRCEAD
jgi:DNA-binding NarL/FixJ family response regulator